MLHVILHNSMALGSTQPLTEKSTRNISWRVKAASAQGWQPLSSSCADCLKLLQSQSPGARSDSPGLKWDCFTFFTSQLPSQRVFVRPIHAFSDHVAQYWKRKTLERPLWYAIYRTPVEICFLLFLFAFLSSFSLFFLCRALNLYNVLSQE
jgi:hypothetical protein